MPLLWLSIAFLGGIVLAGALPAPRLAWLAAFGAAVLAGLAGYLLKSLTARSGCFIHAGNLITRVGSAAAQTAARAFGPAAAPIPLFGSLPAAALLGAVFFGAARFQIAQPTIDPGFIAWYAAGEMDDIAPAVELTGVIVKPADERDRYTALTVRADQIRLKGVQGYRPVAGLVLARVAPGESWRYGDRLALTGSLEIPPEFEDFSYRDYLARKGVHAYFPWSEARFLESGLGNPVLGVIYALKGRALEVVYSIFPDPEASLLAGILLGVESGIPETVQEAFKATGTSHIIAISG